MLPEACKAGGVSGVAGAMVGRPVGGRAAMSKHSGGRANKECPRKARKASWVAQGSQLGSSLSAAVDPSLCHGAAHRPPASICSDSWMRGCGRGLAATLGRSRFAFFFGRAITQLATHAVVVDERKKKVRDEIRI